MSYSEYHEMYKQCQKNKGKYFMITYDLVNSCNGFGKRTTLDIYLTLRNFYELEKIFRANGSLPSYSYWLGRPSGLIAGGDCIAYIVKVDTNFNEQDLIKRITQIVRNHLVTRFHYAYGYCDTLNYEDGADEYYSGYLFRELSTAHKLEGLAPLSTTAVVNKYKEKIYGYKRNLFINL